MKAVKNGLIFALTILSLATIQSKSYASIADVNSYTLADSSGTAISSYAVVGSATTAAIPVRDNVGYSSLVVDVTGGGVNITYQLSLDGTNWYTPYTTDGTTLTSTPSVVSNLTSTSWIVLPSRMAKFIRFNIYQASGSPTITLKYLYQAYIGY